MAERTDPPVPPDESAPGEPVEVAEVHSTVPVRNVPVILLTIAVGIWFLDWAQPVLVPLVLGLIVSYALAPIVDRLEKYRVPRWLSAAVLILGLLFGIAAAAISLKDEAVSLIETLPEAVQKIQEAARQEFGDSGRTIEKVHQAAQELEKATEQVAPGGEAPSGVTRVQIERPRFNIRDYLWTTVSGAAMGIGAAVIVLFLAFFLLASGDMFRRKWVQLSGPALSRKKITVQVMDAIAHQVQRYLGVQVLTSVLVGVLSGLAFWAIGLENAAVWGIAAGVLNLVPYLGAIITTGGTALVAFFQFGTLGMAAAVAAISLVINTIEGNFLTPWMSSRAARMNAVVVFGGLLFWGWLWGGWGVVLGVPIMMVFKAVCDHVEDLKPVGEFMGE